MFLEIERKTFGLLENVVDGAVKTVLCVYRRTFDGFEKTCQSKNLKKLFVLSFCSFERKFLASWTKLLSKIVKTSFYVIIGTFWLEIFCWRRFIFSSFPDIEQLRFGLLAKSVWRGCKNAIYVCRRQLERSEKKRQNFLQISFFSIRFWRWAKNFRPSGKNFVCRIVKSAFYVILGTFLREKTFFSENCYISTFLGHWAIFLVGAVVKIAIDVSIKTLWVEIFWGRTFFFFVFFGHRANIFWALWQKILSRSVKTAL